MNGSFEGNIIISGIIVPRDKLQSKVVEDYFYFHYSNNMFLSIF